MNKKWEKPTNVGTGRVASYNAADLASGAQRPACAPEVSTSLREKYKAGDNARGASRAEKKRSRKLLKVIAASGLAFFMGIGTLCGVVIAPMNSAQASVGGEDAPLTPQEQLLAGTLELDPETDPVVYTTDWGLNIKFHNNFGSLDIMSSGGLSGYLYFTMGSYNNSAINWIIIGQNPYLYWDGSHDYNITTLQYTTYTLSDYIKETTTNVNYYVNNISETVTPAGSAISQDGTSDIVVDFSRLVFTNTVSKSEIPNGCVLVISQNILCNSVFNQWKDEYSTTNYSGSILQTTVTNLYSNLGLTEVQKSKIYPQTLYTLYYKGYSSTISEQYLFPLAGSSTSETFYIGTYLNSNTKRSLSAYWWTRSGANSSYFFTVQKDGGVGGSHAYGSSAGVRPAFVLKI